MRSCRLHILLHEDGVGVGGQGRAGEDANRRAPRFKPCRRAAGGDPAAQGQLGRTLRIEVGVAHRVAIDRRVVERRQRHRRVDIGRDHASIGLGKRHIPRIRDRCDPLGDQRQRRIDRHELAAEGEAIVSELRHSCPALEIAVFFDQKCPTF